MPKQKDLKRLVRSRMTKTGESYTAARTQLVRKKSRSSPRPSDSAPEPEVAKRPTADAAASPATTRAHVPALDLAARPASKRANSPATGLAAVAGMSDEAVNAKTGRTWAQWVKLLDGIEAARMAHRDIAAYVHEVHQVTGWWSQAVTVGYERIKGLRERGQRRDGHYECSKSRTFPVPVEALFRAFASASGRRKWLGDVDLAVRRSTPPRSLRFAWPDGTSVEVGFLAKGEKSQAAIQHTKLPSKAEATRLKAWWSERFDRLAEILRG